MPVEWVRLKLDLEAFDDAGFEPYLLRCRDAGCDFTSLARVGDTASHRRALYELNKTCSADIPERGEFYTFEEYLATRIDTPTFDPQGVILAMDKDGWVGFSTTSIQRAESYAFSEMTGVLPSHRGRGISLALKTAGRRLRAQVRYAMAADVSPP